MARITRAIRKIIWSVDAFEETGPMRLNALQALRCLAESTGARIEPVYVLSPADLNLSIEFTPPWIEQYRPAAENALEKLVSDLKFPALEEGTVLIHPSDSRRGAAARLSDYAIRNEGDVIVVSTHARHGVSRLLLGSFAETLILYSRVPVLVVGSGRVSPSCFRSILFPTDLGPNSRASFHRAVCIASQLKASLTLFHAIPNPIEPVLQSGMFLLGGSWVPVHTYFAKDTERRRRQLEKWTALARGKGVKTDFVLDDRGGNTANMVIDYAKKKKISAIAMAAESGPITAALIGSITRQVVRHAECPVWILRSPEVTKRRR